MFEGKLDDGINNESDLWEVKKDSKLFTSTSKNQLNLLKELLKNHKKSKKQFWIFFRVVVLSFLAAHQLNRVCYGMELDPKYCQVIIDRMFKFR